MKLAQSSKLKAQRLFLVLGLIILFCIAGVYLYIQPKYVVPILTYHHIDGQGDVSSLSVSTENFRRQMQFLSRHKYNVISLAELVRAIKNKEKLAHNTVVLTFDDGYEDNYRFAYPVLKQYQLPATIFVIVDSLDGPSFLSLNQLEEMAASGIIDIESHTLTHSYLPVDPQEKLEQEIGRSKKILEQRLNKGVEFLAYPIGGFSSQVEETVKKYGYQAACTTNKGKAQTYRNDDLFALKRIKVKDSFPNLFVFWVKVSGYYNLFRKARTPY